MKLHSCQNLHRAVLFEVPPVRSVSTFLIITIISPLRKGRLSSGVIPIN